MFQNQFNFINSAYESIELVDATSVHSFPRHTHERYGVGFISHGAQRSRSGRGRVEAIMGDVITVNPGEVHDGAPIGDGGRSWKMLYFEPKLVSSILQTISEGKISDAEFFHPVIKNSALASQFLKLFHSLICDSWRDNCPESWIADTNFQEENLYLLLSTVLNERQNIISTGYSRNLKHARARIDDDPTQIISLNHLAHDTGLSKYQVLRGFRKMTGLTPHAYIIQKRIDIARKMIKRGGALADVAAASGFVDQSHMSRIFKNKYGYSPGVFAKGVFPKILA